MSIDIDISELNGKVIHSIEGLEENSIEIVVKTKDGAEYKMLHHQDCCEHVYVYDVDSSLSHDDIDGALVINAEEVSNYDGGNPDRDDSYTWTFYKIDTDKGYLWIRWLGSSNGYYSEYVDFLRVK